jgi:carbonic anhydrase
MSVATPASNRRSLLLAALVSLAPASALATPSLSSGAVLDAEAQAALTPDAVLERLQAGNARFVAGLQTPQDLRAEVAATASGQYPLGFVLSCVDSRVPVESVFDVGIGDVFVGRVAGNFVNDDLLGSMEFATAVAGAKVIVVLGHTACGAVKGACDNVQIGHIASLVNEIQPSVAAVTPEGETCSSSNAAHVDAIATHNVQRTIEEIRASSEILRQREADGQLRIVGGMYDLATGVVTFSE